MELKNKIATLLTEGLVGKQTQKCQVSVTVVSNQSKSYQ